MANFDLYLPFLLHAEGGFIDDPADPGGATNKGITLATLCDCAQDLLGLAPTLSTLKALTDRDAGVIYKLRYWDAMRADAIPHQGLAEGLVDFHVNAGHHAVVALQQAINDVDPSRMLAVDGVLGPTTFQALLDAPGPVLASRLAVRRIDYYQDLAARTPSLRKFLAGWTNRSEALARRRTS